MRRERRARRGLAVAAAMLALQAGCSENTSIMLIVEGDLRPGVDADSLQITVTGGDAERTVGPHALTEAAGLPQSLLILPGEVVTESVDVRVWASLGGVERVRAERRLAFEAGRQAVYRICLDRDCLGMATRACVEGVCSDEADADADTDADTDGDADSDSDADSDADVDEPQCDPSMCDDGQYCNGSEACVGTRCVPGVPPTEDGLACTDGTCDEGADRVDQTPNDARCEDGNECTINTCVVGVGCSVAPRDQDSDGHGDAACGGDDCDDGTAAVNPEAAEACNGWDDNCDGEIDEAGCDCEANVFADEVYLFCDLPDSWPDVRGACDDWGYDLVRIDGDAEQDWLWLTASSIATGDWWIGLNDRDTEAIFEWLDGTVVWEWGRELGYNDWGGENPIWSFGGDCVVLAEEFGGQWDDVECSASHPFICELAGH